MTNESLAELLPGGRPACRYCREGASLAFAGRLTATELVNLCDEHRSSHDRHARIIGRILEAVPEARTTMPRWRYFELNGWLYAWNTERLDEGKPWRAFIYKPDGHDGLDLVAERGFAQRQKAKAQAYRWRELAAAQVTQRPPARVLTANRPGR